MNKISSAIKVAGGAQALADSLGISVQRVCNWQYRNRVPAEFIRRIEQVTGGKVSAYDLLPQIDEPNSNTEHENASA